MQRRTAPWRAVSDEERLKAAQQKRRSDALARQARPFLAVRALRVRPATRCVRAASRG
jgi:hypothetical protein